MRINKQLVKTPDNTIVSYTPSTSDRFHHMAIGFDKPRCPTLVLGTNYENERKNNFPHFEIVRLRYLPSDVFTIRVLATIVVRFSPIYFPFSFFFFWPFSSRLLPRCTTAATRSVYIAPLYFRSFFRIYTRRALLLPILNTFCTNDIKF